MEENGLEARQNYQLKEANKQAKTDV